MMLLAGRKIENGWTIRKWEQRRFGDIVWTLDDSHVKQYSTSTNKHPFFMDAYLFSLSVYFLCVKIQVKRGRKTRKKGRIRCIFKFPNIYRLCHLVVEIWFFRWIRNHSNYSFVFLKHVFENSSHIHEQVE